MHTQQNMRMVHLARWSAVSYTHLIKFYNNRTDMDSDDYGGKNWKQYLEDFNKEYPNIKVDVITDTNLSLIHI